tara:strand:- start:19356 stop:19580 length:225 start_codon:yes stop_codon:yes gene_type:complete
MKTSDNIYKAKGKIEVGKTIKVEKSKGLGDTIEKFTHMTGLNTLADMTAKFIGKDDCGCDKRRDKLNEMFPYKK